MDNELKTNEEQDKEKFESAYDEYARIRFIQNPEEKYKSWQEFIKKYPKFPQI